MKTTKLKNGSKSQHKAGKFKSYVLALLLIVALATHGILRLNNSYLVTIMVDDISVKSWNTWEESWGLKKKLATGTVVFVIDESHYICGFSEIWSYTGVAVNTQETQGTDQDVSVNADPTPVSGDAFSLPRDNAGNRSHTHDSNAVLIKYEWWNNTCYRKQWVPV